MGYEDQVAAVKRALDLEIQVQQAKRTVTSIRFKTFCKAEPKPPVLQKAVYNEPPIQTTVKLDIPRMVGPWLAGILLVLLTLFTGITFLMVIGQIVAAFGLVWVFYYYFKVYKAQKKASYEQIKESAEYKQLCAQAQEETRKTQQKYDAEFALAKTEYENVTLPNYKKELKAWKEKNAAELSEAEAELEKLSKELAQHYDETRIVPVQYRNIEALDFIYSMISTSDFDVKRAIEKYDENINRNLEAAKLRAQQQANELASQQNALLENQNEIAQKARRDANIAAVASTIQQHKLNKTIKDMSSKH